MIPIRSPIQSFAGGSADTGTLEREIAAAIGDAVIARADSDL